MSARVVIRGVLRGPWSARAWSGTAHVALGSLVGSVSSTVILVVCVAIAVLLPTVRPRLTTAAVLLRCSRWFTACHRWRFATFLDVHIAPPDALPDRPAGARPQHPVLAEIAAPATGRQLVYHLLIGTCSSAGMVVVLVCWVVGLGLSSVVAYSWAVMELGPPVLAGLTLVGLVFLFGTPSVVRAITALDTTLARALLGPSRSQVLARRVESLTRSRAGMVDAADAERRRIERDLHDGVQQRLTSLAVSLGIARETLSDLPEPASKVIVHAHEEVKGTLVELANFVRGLHPAVLEDRGLGAAIPGIAARAPIPVGLDIDLPSRPAPVVEAAAYFVVSEALTNVIKHSRATCAEVAVRGYNGRLCVRIVDDGCGGAREDAGSGLRGLAQRVDSIDGTLWIDSPAGGPTVVTADLPCAW